MMRVFRAFFFNSHFSLNILSLLFRGRGRGVLALVQMTSRIVSFVFLPLIVNQKTQTYRFYQKEPVFLTEYFAALCAALGGFADFKDSGLATKI